MLALRDHPGGSSPGLPDEIPSALGRVSDECAVVCAACAAPVTASRHRIAVNGGHEHRFMNPAGLLFAIGCFALAIGCRMVGPDSAEYAWFPGFSWRCAMCASCGQHLGWHFRGDGRDAFFGLILNRLRQPTADA